MKRQLSIFRVLTFILVPFAGLFGLLGLFALIGSLMNPGALIPAFLFIAFTIYTFASLAFLTRGIDTGRPLKASLRDWIRVNAYVAAFLGITSILNLLSVLVLSDAVLRDYFEKAMAEQGTTMPPMMNPALLVTIIKIIFGFLGVLGVVLLTHIILNFRLMKVYRHLFELP